MVRVRFGGTHVWEAKENPNVFIFLALQLSILHFFIFCLFIVGTCLQAGSLSGFSHAF